MKGIRYAASVSTSSQRSWNFGSTIMAMGIATSGRVSHTSHGSPNGSSRIPKSNQRIENPPPDHDADDDFEHCRRSNVRHEQHRNACVASKHNRPKFSGPHRAGRLSVYQKMRDAADIRVDIMGSLPVMSANGRCASHLICAAPRSSGNSLPSQLGDREHHVLWQSNHAPPPCSAAVPKIRCAPGRTAKCDLKNRTHRFVLTPGWAKNNGRKSEAKLGEARNGEVRDQICTPPSDQSVVVRRMPYRSVNTPATGRPLMAASEVLGGARVELKSVILRASNVSPLTLPVIAFHSAGV